MRTILLLSCFVLLLFQQVQACSCSNILPFQQSIKNANNASDILFLGEIQDFRRYNDRFNWHEIVTVTPVKDYIGNINRDKIFMMNGPESACIRSFDIAAGSQLIIFAAQTDRIEEGETVFLASFCEESVLIYNNTDNVVKGFIKSLSLPPNEMTLHEVEQLIKSSIE